jgi:hypothetical protein
MIRTPWPSDSEHQIDAQTVSVADERHEFLLNPAKRL